MTVARAVPPRCHVIPSPPVTLPPLLYLEQLCHPAATSSRKFSHGTDGYMRPNTFSTAVCTVCTQSGARTSVQSASTSGRLQLESRTYTNAMSSILKMVLLGPSKARVLLVTARVPWLSAPGPIEEYRPITHIDQPSFTIQARGQARGK